MIDPVLQDNIRCVGQAVDLVRNLHSEAYSATSPDAPGASIGSHIRHNIDHYKSFLEQVEVGKIDYDDRSRETAAETDPGVAFQRLHSIGSALQKLGEADLEAAVEVKMDSGSSTEWSGSTLRRELQFLLSHSVHHYAIIAMICRAQDIAVPEDFGVAPSTLKYRCELRGEGPKCAP